MKVFFKKNAPVLVLAVVGLTAFFLVHRQWSALPLVSLALSLPLAVAFLGGWGRFAYCLLVGLQGCIDRHFFLHYSSCVRKAGSQALITLHITNGEEISSYLTSVFPREILIWVLLIAALVFLFKRRNDLPLMKLSFQLGGCCALLLVVLAIACNFVPPINEYMVDWRSHSEYHLAHSSHRFMAKDLRPGHKEVALLVIGESHRYDEMERLLQNGELPHFRQAREDGALYAFTDMITCYPQTYFSVFTLLTRRMPDSINRFWPQKGVMTLFREAGWTVCYLTYQDRNLLDFGYDAVVNEGDEYINHRRISGTTFDTGMLPILKRKINDNDGKLLIVIKMMGCHFPSLHRYPDECRLYLPDGQEENSGNPMSGKPDDIVKMKNAYRNAITFSGAFIDSIMQCVMEETSPGFMMFLSDHGIINYDDGENAYFGKAKSGYHIPAYLYFNEAYRRQCLTVECDERLKSRLNSCLTNSYVFETVESLAGISDPGMRGEFDLTGAEFQERQKRMVWLWDEQLPYDDLK